MDALWWVLWSGLCALGSGLLVFFVMQSRTEVLLARQREKLAASRAEFTTRHEMMRDSMQQVEDATRRQALDEFLADIRIEERTYVRTQQSLFTNRKSLIRQERIFFRNIPLSNWVEQEMPFEEGADAEKLAQSMSVFTGSLMRSMEDQRVRKLLQ
jgi:hypothetical protein